MREWTEAQLTAITASGCDLLVSAAAGSGKTAALTERLIRKLTNADAPAELSRMLIVTFTRPAAAELRERIGKALSEAIEAEPHRRDLVRQSLNLAGAHIGTIHSFCLSLIRSNFAALGLDPAVRTADENEALTVALSVMDGLIADRYAQSERTALTEAERERCDAFIRLTDTFVTDRDDGLAAFMYGVYVQTRNYTVGEAVISDSADSLRRGAETDFFSTVWGKEIKSGIAGELSYYEKIYAEAVQYFASDEALERKYGAAFASDLEFIRALTAALGSGYSEASATAQSYKKKSVGRTSVPDDENIIFYKSARDGFDKFRKSLCGKLALPQARISDIMRRAAGLCDSLYDLISEFSERYSAEKSRRGMIDFSDIEHLALRLLTDKDGAPTDIARQTAAQFDEIYIDEYQDINPVQDMIFRSIARGNRFMVGDIKQSIYGFRGAAPEIFSEYRSAFPKYGTSADDAGTGVQIPPPAADCGSIAGTAENGCSGSRTADVSEDIPLCGHTAGAAENGCSGSRTADAPESDYPNVHTVGAAENVFPDRHTADVSAKNRNSAFDLAGPNESGRTVYLSHNFRCDRSIIDFTNLVFSAVMKSECGSSIDYGDDDRLVFAKKTDGAETSAAVCVAVISQVSDSETEDGEMNTEADTLCGTDGKKLREPTAADAEAEFVAAESARLIASGKYSPGDIRILLRSGVSNTERFARAFARHGVPFESGRAIGFFERPHILLALSLLRCIDNPTRDIPLAAVLCSPLFGFTPDELISVKNNIPPDSDSARCVPDEAEKPRISLLDCLRAYTEEYGFEKGRRFLSQLDGMRRKAAAVPSDKLLWQLCGETPLLCCGNDSDGFDAETRRSDLLRLYDYARGFERGGFRGLSAFLSSVDSLIKRDPHFDFRKETSSESGSVGVMTIHKSKGLEFPVIFLCGASKNFNKADAADLLMIDKKLGVCTKLRDENGFLRYDTPMRAAAQQRENEQIIDEEMRLLYVALTRARERLYVTAGERNPDALIADADECARYPSPYSAAKRASYMKWILTAAASSRGGLPHDVFQTDTSCTVLSDSSMRIVSARYRTECGRVIFCGDPLAELRTETHGNYGTDGITDISSDTAGVHADADGAAETTVEGHTADGAAKTSVAEHAANEAAETTGAKHAADGAAETTVAEHAANDISATTAAASGSHDTVGHTARETGSICSYGTDLLDTEKLRELLRSRLTNNYPRSYGARLPAKLSVSALHPGILDEDPAPSPSDAERYASMLSDSVGAGYFPPDGYTVSDENVPFGYITDKNTFNTDRPEFEIFYGSEASGSADGPDGAPELKGIKRPRFLEETEHIADGAERGTATHVFLQFCDWNSVCSGGIEAECGRMVQSGFMTAVMAELISVPMLRSFFGSRLFSELRQARKVWRELRFNVLLPACDFTEDAERKRLLADEKLLVQGIIDCLYITSDGKLRLLDYKTDRIPRGNHAAEFLRKRYKDQLESYKKAAAVITGMPLDRCIIYALSCGLEIDV